jgi:hypothetical protein
VLILVALLERFHRRVGVAALFEIEVGEAVARARGRRWAENPDFDRRQRRVDVLPRLGGVRALAEGIGGERLVDVGLGQIHRRPVLGLDDREAVDPDRDFDDRLDAVLDAVVILAFLDRPRRVFDVGILASDPGAEEFHARPGAGRFDRRVNPGRPSELLGDRLRERVNGRGADDSDAARRSGATAAAIRPARHEQRRKRQRGEHLLHELSPNSSERSTRPP